jgi:hypothetical protein
MTDLVLTQLRQLAGTLTVLHGRVREAVAVEIAKAIADSVAEVISASLGGREVGYRRYAGQGSSYSRSDWDDPDPHGWHSQPGRRYHDDDEEEDRSSMLSPAPVAALALAVAAGRWWLARNGSPAGAAGIGLTAGMVLLAGGPLTQGTLAVLWAVQRLLAATDALGEGASVLGKI